MKNLAAALVEAQQNFPPIPKDSENPHFRSKFASLHGVMENVLPVLNKHGLALMQHPTTLDGQPALRTVLIHAESGELVEDTMLLVLAKNDPQGQGSALTYARRYAVLSTLGLVADEDDDGQRASGNGVRNRTTDPPPPAPDYETRGAPEPQQPTDNGDPSQVVVTFGKKHKDKTLGRIVVSDRGYLEWMTGGDFEPKTADQRRIVEAARLVLAQDEDIPF